MSVTLRTVRADDAVDIRRIFADAVHARRATFDTSPPSLDDVSADLAVCVRGPHPGIVAEVDGRVRGYALTSPHSAYAPYARLAELSVYVDPLHQQRGIGQALLGELIARSNAAGFTKLLSRIFADNVASRTLCARHGFREVGIYQRHARLDGVWRDVVIVELLLENAMKPSVLFVCRHNTGRSQMAEAYLRHFTAGAVDVASAGTIAAEVPDPGVVAAMAEDGIDISAARPKLLDPERIAHAERIITMGCDVEGVPRIDDDWGLPDPKGQPPERVREIRDLVREKARALADDLLARTV